MAELNLKHMLIIRDIFHQLEGTWSFNRKLIDNKIMNNLLGVVTGKVNIIYLNEKYHDLHYIEEGQLSMHNGKKFNIRKEYIYSYNDKNNQITKYFAVNYIKKNKFYILNFEKKSNSLIATGKHECKYDHYIASYEFFKCKFNLTYMVNGPSKDYIFDTVYTKHNLRD